MKDHQKIALASLATAGIISLPKVFRKVTGRSVSSWVSERALIAMGIRNHFDKFTLDELAKDQTGNNDPRKDPSRLVGYRVESTDFEGMQVFTWNDRKDQKQVTLYYLHGGGYVVPPVAPHYLSLGDITRRTNARVIMPIYLKAPQYTYQEVLPLVYEHYQHTVEDPNIGPVILAGDSAGGGMALGLAYDRQQADLSQPDELILLSPWLDITNSHPQLADYAHLEALLSPAGINLGRRAYLGKDGDPTDPRVSPIHVSGVGLAPISMFVGTHEILYPDVIDYSDKLHREGVAHNLFVAEKMDHVYPYYPTPEATKAREQIAAIINRHQPRKRG